jgi:hypothetical protein
VNSSCTENTGSPNLERRNTRARPAIVEFEAAGASGFLLDAAVVWLDGQTSPRMAGLDRAASYTFGEATRHVAVWTQMNEELRINLGC